MTAQPCDRREILLRAAYDMLTKCNADSFIPCETSVFYDGAMCGGYCLREDIAYELGIDINSEPLEEK